MYFPDQIIEQSITYWEQQGGGEGKSLMIFLAEKSNTPIDALIQSLNEAGISFFGGVFPRVISGIQSYESGAVVRIVSAPYGYIPIQEQADSDTFGDGLLEPNFKEGEYTIITLVDGLMNKIPKLLSCIHNRLGDYGSFVGGGAGSLSLEQAPCLFCNDGFFQDGGIVCPIDRSSRAGVQHGWEKLHGPLVATKTDRNIVYELNWQNAFDVYHEVVSSDAQRTFNADNFFDTSKGYPFGIYRDGAEDIVRDPIAVTPEGGLVCVGEVPENAVLHILKGENQNLIASARKAGQDCKGDFPPPKDTLVVDCISRVIFLEDHFSDELQALRDGLELHDTTPLQGILSLGEISSYEDGSLTFYNKTIVVTALKT